MSDRDFVNLYPWVSSDDFTYSEQYKTLDFFSIATAGKQSPSARTIWTPAYLDEAGEGMMVTLSGPVYDEDDFMGVVSLDLTTARIGELIDSEYRGYLVDTQGTVVAGLAPMCHMIRRKQTFDNITGMSESNIEKITQAEENVVHIVGTNYVYIVSIPETRPGLCILLRRCG